MYVQQQQQPVYYQPQPQVVQMQPMMQPMQPMMQPMQPMMQQPMYGQPMMVQPQVMVQPVMQPVIQVVEPFPMAGGVLLGSNPMGGQHTPGVPSYGSIQKVLDGLKGSNFIIRYMEPNFRPNEGGYKFGIFGSDKSNALAYGYATANGDATIEATDFADAYGIVQVKNTSATIHNIQTGQRDMFGTVALNRGTCGSFQVAAEKNGNRSAIFQNRQFSLLFCICCPGLYLISYLCCNDKAKFNIVNGEGTQIGSGEYRTDNMNTFREVDITLNGGDVQQHAFVILEVLLYMFYKVRNSLKGQDADVSFEF